MFLLDCKCLVNTEYNNTLVGVEYHENDGNRDIVIHFPLGYRLSPQEDERGQRQDILLLLSVLRRYSQKVDGTLPDQSDTGNIGFPVEAYLNIISDYINRGYYKEKDVVYKVAKRGKINWNRTIKTQRPYIQGKNVFYLDYVIRNQKTKDNEWITLIHKYCVYISFKLMGWLFTGYIPEKPKIKKNDNLFESVLKEKLSHTFDDRNKRLFKSMMEVLGYERVSDIQKSFKYGTTSFYHVWESMIDWVYGIDNKQDYFPRTKWCIGGKVFYKNPLEPDSIMPYKGDIYILDAKYYKYGITKDVRDLPDTSSIHKQITYGEYIARRTELHTGPDMKIYNAFILPYATNKNDGIDYVGELAYIGEAVSDWKKNTEIYEHVEGIMLDTKMLMEMNVKQDVVRIQKLAEFIEDYYNKARVLDGKEK